MSTHMNLTPIDRSVLAACAFGASQRQIIRMLIGPQPEPVPLEMKMAALKSLSALESPHWKEKSASSQVPTWLQITLSPIFILLF
jgi:hypothetical protein